MKWNDFYKSVKDGDYQSVYFFTGPEELNKKEALAKLRQSLLPAGLEQLNDVTLEGCGVQEIIDSAETLPVMCERRVVVVRDWPPLISGKSKNEEENTTRMLEWLKDVPDSCVLVFYMSVEPDSRKKLPKYLKGLPGYVEFEYLSGALLMKWCNQQLKPLGKTISSDAMNELSLMAGQDLSRLSGELKKLASYIGEASEIRPQDVRAIVAPSPEYSVFMILDHLLEGRAAEATEVVNSVLQTEPSVIRLISLMTNQLRIDAHVKYALETNANLQETLTALNINAYRAKHIRRQVERIPADALRQRYQWCTEADYDIKSGRVRDRAALNALMLKLAMPQKATNSLNRTSNRH